VFVTKNELIDGQLKLRANDKRYVCLDSGQHSDNGLVIVISRIIIMIQSQLRGPETYLLQLPRRLWIASPMTCVIRTYYCDSLRLLN